VTVATRSYFAQRGDLELRGLNRELSAFTLAVDAFVGAQATKRNDGVQLTIFFNPARQLFLQMAAPDTAGWFVSGSFASYVDLVFSSPLDRRTVKDGTFAWRWSGGGESVSAASVTYSEQDRQVRVPAPSSLPVSYTGELTLSFADITSDEGNALNEAVSLHYDITPSGAMKTQPGLVSPTRQDVQGHLAVGRMVVAFGYSVDEMMASYLRQRQLTNQKILTVIQLEGPNKSLEVFILWWAGTTPRVMSVTPASSGTLVSGAAPGSIYLQFDQPVQNPSDFAWFDGTALTDPSFTVAKIDDVGKQWRVTKTGLFSTEGQHTLKISGLPGEDGDLPCPPALYSWQVMPATVNTAASGVWKWVQAPQSGDPGTGRIGVDTADPSSATTIYISKLSADGKDASPYIQALKSGDQVVLYVENDTTTRVRFAVGGAVTSNGSWLTIPVTYVSGGGVEPGNNTRVTVLASYSSATPPASSITPFCEQYTTPGGDPVQILAHTPFHACTLLVFLNGVEQTDCYTYSATPSPRITFASTPPAGWNLVIKGWST
jgi:hypothetical protein